MADIVAARFTLSRLAVKWCKEKTFQRWAGVDSEEAARAAVLQICAITSRRDLDTKVDAAEAFHLHIRRPYMAHLEKKPLEAHA